jgi:15-cis-phytoene synthase
LREDARLNDLYRQAALATSTGSKSFYFATRFFPEDLARSAHAVYWFCRTTDDLVDECDTIAQGARDLERWHEDLIRALEDGFSEDPVLHLFVKTARLHEIPSQYAFELIEGMRMDLDGTRYQTFDELRVFCYRVASVVGLMMSHVIGFTNPEDKEAGLQHAIDLGIAMQVTNILRDVAEDLTMGRIYLPKEDLDRFEYSEEELRAAVVDDRFRELIRFQIDRARTYYRRAQPGIKLLNSRGRFAVQIASDVYSRILTRIERAGYDVFAGRAVVPAREKYWLTARSLAVPALRWSLRGVTAWRS